MILLFAKRYNIKTASEKRFLCYISFQMGFIQQISSYAYKSAFPCGNIVFLLK